MYPFIETIRIERGEIMNLSYHNQRFNDTRSTFWKDCSRLELSEYIQAEYSEAPVKCRVVYRERIEEVSYTPYVIRPVNSLQLVYSDSIEYTYKSTDREAINALFSQRGNQDDILIVQNGLITDTSIANVALYDGNVWHTPRVPLLRGTQRAALLNKGVIFEKDIKQEELFDYSHMVLFNAMIDFGQIKIDVTARTISL